jgi:dienelactone hydrolase
MIRYSVAFLLLFMVVSAKAAFPTIEDFNADASMIDANLSPDGTKIATVWNIGDERFVIVLRTEDNKILSRFGDNINRPFAVTWANSERLLVKLQIPFDTDAVRRDAETHKDFDIDDYFLFIRVVSTDIYGTDIVQLVNNDRASRATANLANIPHYLPNDKEHILMAVVRNSRFSLLKVNVYTGISERVAIGTKKTVDFIVDDNGHLSFRYDYDSYTEILSIYEYRSDEQWAKVDEIYFDEDEEKNNNIELNDLVGLYDNKLIYLQRNPTTGFNEILQATHGEDKKSILVSLQDEDIVSVLKNENSGEVVGYQTLDNVYRSHYFDADRQAYYDKVAANFAEQNFFFTSFSDDYNKAVVLSLSPNNPGTYYLYDNKLSVLSLFNYPYPRLQTSALASSKIIIYPTRDNLNITAYLLLPPNYDAQQQYPLVVLPHGGPQARDFLEYDRFSQLISTQGYIVVKPNFRGSTGYGKAFEEAGNKQWGQAMQEDLEDAVAYLVKQKYVASDKVCIVGLSYGGYAALMGVVKTPELYQCAVSINGISHLSELVKYSAKQRDDEKSRTLIYEKIGHPKRDKAQLDANSPALHVNKIRTPILMIAGEDDQLVPFSQSKNMQRELEKAQKMSRLIELDDARHNVFRFKKDRDIVYEEVLNFLSQYLSLDHSKN